MARGRIQTLLATWRSLLDGGASYREAERRAELAQLRFRDGRAIPRHIAVIMDGNGRWATQRHLPRSMGHHAGVEALRRVVQLCDDQHVPMLSVYAFSTENWGRPQEEVDALMRLMWETIRTDVERLHRNGVRLRHIGRLADLAPDIQEAIRHMMELTQHNTKLHLNVCFNYGGRAEIVDAVREMMAAGMPAEEVTEEAIGRHLYTRDLPDPDLVIRTGGEMRLSNYLIWQAAYAEYYSTPTLWPDFDDADLLAALDAFAGRKRRFGKLDSQVAEVPPASAPPSIVSSLPQAAVKGAR
ncbi:MAG: di-trans,poly-cis-decaprenylcistransferase [Ktedonobacterales bacterium]|nr:di-trans,poly-cis-decaprenylcistransferase [Ktedonobacterales bacterium]